MHTHTNNDSTSRSQIKTMTAHRDLKNWEPDPEQNFSPAPPNQTSVPGSRLSSCALIMYVHLCVRASQRHGKPISQKTF